MQFFVLHLRQLVHALRSRAWLLGWVFGGTSLVGCSFNEAEAGSPPNTCMLPMDCPGDLSCEAGVCVTTSTDATLDLLLEVTPKRMPDGSQPFPILYGPFSLQGGRRDFNLPTPVTLGGRVHNGPEVINAQLSFVPTKSLASLAKPIIARSGLTAMRSEFSVQLLSGLEYRVWVQPTDAMHPPYTRTFVAEVGVDLDFDYQQFETSTLTFVIGNAPPGVSLKAVAKDGNHVLSNTKVLETGRATLTFTTANPPPYRVEIAANPTAPTSTGPQASRCDSERSLVPTITVDDTTFKREASTATPGAFELTVDLPVLAEPVSYEGTIDIQQCSQRKGLEGLPISLRSTSIAIANMPQGMSASFSSMAEAIADDDGNPTQTFCARVLPGEYVVLVTPPATINCEVFAEKRPILAASTEPDMLALRMPARLNGKILDREMLPVANATINAIALGIDTTMMLAEDDLTVPIYNRSRQTSSNSSGQFALPVDVGVYDLIVKPPMQSGFAWQIRPGVNIGSARREDFTTRVELNAPALIEGSLQYANRRGQSSLAGAEVHAYTIEDEKMPTERGVEIGHTQADEDGNITLFVSPEPHATW